MNTTRGQCDVDWLASRLATSSAVDVDNNDDVDAPSITTTTSSSSSDAVINGQLVLVDCRPSSEFGSIHIAGAVSLSLPTLIQRRLLKGNLATPSALGYCSANDRGSKVTDGQWKSTLIVLYDESTTTSQLARATAAAAAEDGASVCMTSKMLAVLLENLRKDGYKACLLQGGLNNFRTKYPNLCVSRDSNDLDNNGLQSGLRNLRLTAPPTSPEQREDPHPPPPDGAAFPVEVLPHLFLGDAKNASDLECLQGKGISYILNVTPNVPNKFELDGQFKYLQIPIKDHWSQNLTNYFPQAITFIDEGRRLNHGVLVHCLAGISRSVTVTVAYIMYSMSLSLNDAYDYVKRRKPNVSPNLTFMGQLLDFENALKVDHRLSCPCSCHTNSSLSSSSSSSASSYPFSSSMSTNSSSSSSCFSSPSSAEQSGSANTSGNCRPDFNCSSCACAAYAVNNNSTALSSSSSPTETTVTSSQF